MDGVYCLMSWYYDLNGFEDAPIVAKAAKAFAEKFRKEYGYPPDPYSAMAYIGTMEALRGLSPGQDQRPACSGPGDHGKPHASTP